MRPVFLTLCTDFHDCYNMNWNLVRDSDDLASVQCIRVTTLDVFIHANIRRLSDEDDDTRLLGCYAM